MTRLIGMGVASPECGISQEDATRFAQAVCQGDERQRRLVAALYHRAGVQRRGSALLEREDGPLLARQSFFSLPQGKCDLGPLTSERMHRYRQLVGPLAVQAAAAALSDAQMDAGEITHLVTASCTGFYAPGFDVQLIESLRISRETSRTHLGFMGCHAALNALRVADAYCRANSAARVLVCTAELCSIHHQYGWEPESIVANSLFADGAGAAICTGESAPQTGGWDLVGSGAYLWEESADAMTWEIGDHGFSMTLSARVPELIRQHLGATVIRWLHQHELTLDDVRQWAIHPGGPRIVAAAADALGLSAADLGASQAVLEQHGNMSSPTLLFILQRLRQSGVTGPCVALGFGPGLALELLLLR